MKSKFTFLLLILFVTFFVYNCTTDSKEKVKKGSDSTSVKSSKYHHPNQNVFMWEVKSANSKAYVLGSIHVSKPDFFPLDPRIENAFSEATELVLEVDIAKANLAFLAEKAMYTDGSSLKDHLPKDIYNRLVKSFEKQGLTEAIYGRLKPGFAVMTLLGLELKAAGFDTELGIDMYFAGRTRNEKKNVHELESIEFQMNLFNEGLDKYMSEFVDYSLDDIKNVAKKMDSIFFVWAVGDTAALNKLMSEDIPKSKNMAAILKMLIDDRNIGMAEKIEGYLKTGKIYLVVAGAAHMTGENGIISLLNKKGIYKIKQM